MIQSLRKARRRICATGKRSAAPSTVRAIVSRRFHAKGSQRKPSIATKNENPCRGHIWVSVSIPRRLGVYVVLTAWLRLKWGAEFQTKVHCWRDRGERERFPAHRSGRDVR